MSLEAKKAREKDALVKADPFGAFLAARRPAPQKEASRWPPQDQLDADPVLLDVGKASRTALTRPFNYGLGFPDSPAGDHFSTFLSFGAERELPKPVTSTDAEQRLREEVMRAKRQLLQVTMQAELKALEPTAEKGELTTTLKKLRKAQNYLRHPERTEDAVSESTLGADGQDELEPELEVTLASAPHGFKPNIDTSALTGDTTAGLSPIQSGTHAGTWRSLGDKQPTMGASISMPNLGATPVSSSSFLPAIKGDPSRPGLQSLAIPSAQNSARSIRSASARSDEPLLSGFYTKNRAWNIGLGHRECRARRVQLGLPGGTVVIGNGRMPLFNSSQQLAKGYFYAFRIDEVDDTNFPVDKMKDMSLVIGVSRLPPHHKSLAHPMYAYEVSGAVLLGNGRHLIDKGKWLKTTWDPRELQVGDTVGLLVTQDESDLVVFVNEEQVVRVKTSLGDKAAAEAPSTPASRGASHMEESSSPPSPSPTLQPPSSSTAGPSSLQVPDASSTEMPRSKQSSARGPAKRVLFPILDLHGRVSAVTLLPRQNPPNVPLNCRNKVTA